MIKDLRHKTGVGINKCKEALEESGGDIDKAVKILREKGLATAAKKEGREAKEGMIVIAEDSHGVAIVEVNAETDFVVKNERFQHFAHEIAQEVLKTSPVNLENFMQQKSSKDHSITIDEMRGSVINAIGENIQISRMKLIPKKSGMSVGCYSHQGGRIVTVVEISGDQNHQDLAKMIAMHVAAAKPDYLKPEDVPAHILDQEKEIAKAQMIGKPAEMVDKIVNGKISKFYDEVCLIKQKYIADESFTIEKLVAKENSSLKVTGFTCWQVGQHAIS